MNLVRSLSLVLALVFMVSSNSFAQNKDVEKTASDYKKEADKQYSSAEKSLRNVKWSLYGGVPALIAAGILMHKKKIGPKPPYLMKDASKGKKLKNFGLKFVTPAWVVLFAANGVFALKSYSDHEKSLWEAEELEAYYNFYKELEEDQNEKKVPQDSKDSSKSDKSDDSTYENRVKGVN